MGEVELAKSIPEARINQINMSLMNLGFEILDDTKKQLEGITVEHFFILQKIEKVKEWLAYTSAGCTGGSLISGFEYHFKMEGGPKNIFENEERTWFG